MKTKPSVDDGGSGVYDDIALDLEKSGVLDQGSGLRVDGVRRVRIRYGSDGPSLLLLVGFLLRIVELDVAFQQGRVGPVVRASLLHFLLHLLVLLLVRRLDNAPASSPRDACPEPHANPLFDLEPGSLHDDSNVVQLLSLPGDQGAGVGLLQRRMLVYGQADPGGPLEEGVVRVKMEEVFYSAPPC